ncbi:MAG TPA: hypothetical protein VJU16_01915 [Planctomycetota bacterium]|nr:hypothetical protein [Planctomycetota bacterium]
MSPDIKLIAALVAALLLLAPQEEPKPKDLPKVTLDETGDFHALVRELAEKFGGRVRLRREIPAKDVSVKVRDAGFFEALDALCRAHKEATYCPVDEESDREDFILAADPWVEHTAAYHGHFKTVLLSMKRHVQATPRGETTHAQVDIATFLPPWLSLGGAFGTGLGKEIDTAVAADGRDLRLPENEDLPDDDMDFSNTPFFRGNVSHRRIYLRDFDLSKGLKSFSGTMKFHTVESKVVRMPCGDGTSLELPKGRLSVDSVNELDKAGEKKSWRIALRFTPNEKSKEEPVALPDMLLEGVMYDGSARWERLNLPWKGSSFMVETIALDRAPAWLKFKLITAQREHEIPFSFSNVAFRDY